MEVFGGRAPDAQSRAEACAGAASLDRGNPACAAFARLTPTALVAKRSDGVLPCGPAPRRPPSDERRRAQSPVTVVHRRFAAMAQLRNRQRLKMWEMCKYVYKKLVEC